MEGEFTIETAHAYIADVRWQFASTMPRWPHEYTVKAWRPELTEEFEGFCRLIENEGVVEPWPPPPAPAKYHNHYLVIGDHKYWAMGPEGDRDPPRRSRSSIASPTQGATNGCENGLPIVTQRDRSVASCS